MQEIKYQQRGDQVLTPHLADGETVTVHFKTPTIKSQKNGYIGISNDGNLSGEAHVGVQKTPTEFVSRVVCHPSLSATIMFVDALPIIMGRPDSGTGRYMILNSNTDYYIRILAVGDLPHGVTVFLRGMQ